MEREFIATEAGNEEALAALEVFRLAAARIPAYQQILAERGVDAGDVQTMEDFSERAPVLEKSSTFGRFSVSQLCRDGELGPLAGILTSSGHSGRFSFGLYGAEEAEQESEAVDAALDRFFAVRTRRTLLVNCLPMGVKVPTRACTLAETSVRPDMVVGIVREFGGEYDQVILVGEAAFLKRTGELGQGDGLDWAQTPLSLIVGEEPLAENARAYLEGLFGIDPARPDRSMVVSSFGVAEVGLNLLFEVPQLVALRRAVQAQLALREHLTAGTGNIPVLPSLFTYDPHRAFVEIVDGRLLVTTLNPHRRLPLIRYATGDRAGWLRDGAMEMLMGEETVRSLKHVPVIMVFGRGEHATVGEKSVFPEQIKEGIYAEADLAAAVTGNFRLTSGDEAAKLRVQLSPGVEPSDDFAERLSKAIDRYVPAPIALACEAYNAFGDGMTLDYERKFAYFDSASR